MALQYDFDIGDVATEGLPEPFDGLQRLGLNAERRAMFRSPKTVSALKHADAAIQDLFVDSGFALQVYNSGAPAGRFPKRDEAARIAVVRKLSQNISQYSVKEANWGGFDFAAFMHALGTAEPLEDDTLLAPSLDVSRADPALAAAYEESRRLRRRRAIALSGLVAGLILLLYVAVQMLP